MIDRSSSEPLYLQVKNDIIAQIENDTIKIGDKLMSENEMMQYYNVGRVTIRSALSALAVTGCLKKEQGLGTFCIAKPTYTKRLNIDVLLNCGDTYLVPFLLAGMNRVLEQEGCNLLLHDTKNSMQNTEELLQDILERGTDGVIIQNYGPGNVSESELKPLELFHHLNIPIVSVCGDLPGACASLKIDDCYGARIAARYLLDCGHRRILGLFPEDDYGAAERSAGISEVMELQPDAVFRLLHTSNAAADVNKIISLIRQYDITAVICYNDFFAVQCMHIMQERGFQIPEDLSIIGFDDSALSTSAVPQLTTVSHPKDHMGSDAARTLLHWIHGAIAGPSDTIYRPELVIRQSVLDLHTK